jgi:hypothetical protein
MSKTRLETRQKIAVIRNVATKLHAAEEAIDNAIMKLAELNGELPLARLEAGLSATVCQDAFDRSAQALSALVQCRRETVGAHAALHATQRDMGLGAHAMGDGWKLFQADESPPLTLVQSEAA